MNWQIIRYGGMIARFQVVQLMLLARVVECEVQDLATNVVRNCGKPRLWIHSIRTMPPDEHPLDTEFRTIVRFVG